MKFNGGIGAVQLQWLRDELQSATEYVSILIIVIVIIIIIIININISSRSESNNVIYSSNNERVVFGTNVPICPGSCTDICLLWNYQVCALNLLLSIE